MSTEKGKTKKPCNKLASHLISLFRSRKAGFPNYSLPRSHSGWKTVDSFPWRLLDGKPAD